MARDNDRRDDRREHKEIDINRVIDHLNRAFEKTAEPFGPRSKAVRNSNPRRPGPPEGSKLYEYQIEFCYLINSIQRGPRYIRTKVIQTANNFLDNMTQFSQHDSSWTKHMNSDKCDQNVYKNGKVICSAGSTPKSTMNDICENLSRELNTKIDWHYVGGHPVVKTLGDPVVVREALEQILPGANYNL